MLWLVVYANGLNDRPAHIKAEEGKEEVIVNVEKRYESTNSVLLSGGPDGYGYRYYSTQDGDDVDFNWVDITTTGTAVGASDDWCSGSSDSLLYYLGFSFPFYSKTYDSVSICSNGAVVFDQPYEYFGLSNEGLPATVYSGPRAIIAIMWDDLNPAATDADDIYFESFSSCPDGYDGACAIIQYHNIPRYGNTVLMNFEMILYDDGNIRLLYNSEIYYYDATIGIQDSAADLTNNHFLQYVYDGTPAEHVPDSGTAILFEYPTIIDYDVAVIEVSPAGLIPVDTVVVEATVRNMGTVDLTGVPITLTIYDTATSTTVFTSSATADIPSLSNVTVSFEPFVPEPRKVYLAEVLVSEPQDTVPYNDTLKVIMRTAFMFGDIVDSWDFPSLGDGSGYSFGGITYAPDSGKFYVVSMNPAATVFEFDPNDPANTFTQTSWTLHPFFGTNDIPWGIAYGPGGFYVSHVGFDGSNFIGCYIGYYDGSGNLYDSLDVWANIESGNWIGGMDWDADSGYLWGVYVGGSNSIYKIDVTNKVAVGTFPNITSASLRGVSVFSEMDRVIYGGWNQASIYMLDYAGNLINSSPMPGMADVDVWYQCNNPDDHIFAFVAVNNATNTIAKIATGVYCDQVALIERPVEQNDIRLTIDGRTVHLNVNDPAEIYNIAGRRLGQFRGSTTLERTGLYIIRVKGRSFKVIIR